MMTIRLDKVSRTSLDMSNWTNGQTSTPYKGGVLSKSCPFSIRTGGWLVQGRREKPGVIDERLALFGCLKPAPMDTADPMEPALGEAA
jgi:hypothetical protein